MLFSLNGKTLQLLEFFSSFQPNCTCFALTLTNLDYFLPFTSGCQTHSPAKPNWWLTLTFEAFINFIFLVFSCYLSNHSILIICILAQNTIWHLYILNCVLVCSLVTASFPWLTQWLFKNAHSIMLSSCLQHFVAYRMKVKSLGTHFMFQILSLKLWLQQNSVFVDKISTESSEYRDFLSQFYRLPWHPNS